MKKKIHSKRVSTPRSFSWQFDSTEFLLLAFVAVSLLVFFAWQTGMLSSVGPMVLGASTMK